jgi:hypothetical protein
MVLPFLGKGMILNESLREAFFCGWGHFWYLGEEDSVIAADENENQQNKLDPTAPWPTPRWKAQDTKTKSQTRRFEFKLGTTSIMKQIDYDSQGLYPQIQATTHEWSETLVRVIQWFHPRRHDGKRTTFWKKYKRTERQWVVGWLSIHFLICSTRPEEVVPIFHWQSVTVVYEDCVGLGKLRSPFLVTWSSSSPIIFYGFLRERRTCHYSLMSQFCRFQCNASCPQQSG